MASPRSRNPTARQPWTRPAAIDRDPLDREAIRSALRRHATESLILVTMEGQILAGSETEILGFGSDRQGHHIGEHLHPDDLPSVFEFIEQSRAAPSPGAIVGVRARHCDGSWHRLEAQVIDVDDPDLPGAVLRVRDVTDEPDAASPDPATAGPGIAGAHEQFLSLAETLPLGILSADARGWVVFANAAAVRIFNLSAAELSGRGWERAIARDDRVDVAATAARVIDHGVPQDVMFRVEMGMFPRWAHAKFVPLGEAPGRNGWIATVDDVTDRRRAESQLAHRATHDTLTGLPNRSLLDDRLRQACARLRRDGDSVTVFFVDLDGFKDVNDSFGHQAGDAVLVEIGRRLVGVLREVDTVARLGGDEFVAVCESLPASEIDRLVHRIGTVVSLPIRLGEREILIGASVGVASTDDPRYDAGDLLVLADRHMYRQKRRR